MKVLPLILLTLILTISGCAQNINSSAINPSVSSVADPQTFNLSASDDYVNVMDTAKPTLPNFPTVSVKSGKARGYVKDMQGNPLEGARIGVRSTAVGGFYTTSDAETDAKGYYELEIPTGAAFFYTAGYTINYGAGRAALALQPTDGKVSGFSSTNGVAKNFVMVPYGIADRNKASESPQDGRNYYGGTVRVSFPTNSQYSDNENIPANSVIEVVLTSDGEMMDGASRTFTIRRQTSESQKNFFFITNIPVGKYKISARLVGGKAMKLKETGGNVSRTLGLQPKESNGNATLLFSADADNILVDPAHGHWRDVNIQLLR